MFPLVIYFSHTNLAIWKQVPYLTPILHGQFSVCPRDYLNHTNNASICVVVIDEVAPLIAADNTAAVINLPVVEVPVDNSEALIAVYGTFHVASSHKNLVVPAVVDGFGTSPAAAVEPDLTKSE